MVTSGGRSTSMEMVAMTSSRASTDVPTRGGPSQAGTLSLNHMAGETPGETPKPRGLLFSAEEPEREQDIRVGRFVEHQESLGYNGFEWDRLRRDEQLFATFYP